MFNYVTVGKPEDTGGGIYSGAPDAQAPNDMAKGMEEFEEFESLGHISDAGVTGGMARETTEIKAWGGDVVLVTQTGKTDTFKFRLIDALKEQVQKLVYGEKNVKIETVGGGQMWTIDSTSDELEPHSFVIEEILSNNVIQRTYIPYAKVTEIGEVTHVDSDAIGYDITITAVADNKGKTFTKYMLVPVSA